MNVQEQSRQHENLTLDHSRSTRGSTPVSRLFVTSPSAAPRDVLACHRLEVRMRVGILAEGRD